MGVFGRQQPHTKIRAAEPKLRGVSIGGGLLTVLADRAAHCGNKGLIAFALHPG